MTQVRQRRSVDEVCCYVPAALALHQRPGSAGNAQHLRYRQRSCLNSTAADVFTAGKPSVSERTLSAADDESGSRHGTCLPLVQVRFYPPSAEELSFNSTGACPTCDGTGVVRVVDESTLVPDDSLSIDEGAVVPWQTLMWSLMKEIARKMGVRTDVPFRELTDKEKEIVFHGPADKVHMLYQNSKTGAAGEMDFTYFNAVYTVENALAKVTDEKGMKRVERFLKQGACPECGGSRLSERARAPKVAGITLPGSLPHDAFGSCPMGGQRSGVLTGGDADDGGEYLRTLFVGMAVRLLELGLGYLTLEREAATLSTGERQRVQLARSVRNRTTAYSMYWMSLPLDCILPISKDYAV